MEPFTHKDFYREVLEFRNLMGDLKFWAKPEEQREIAKKALGIAYLNTQPISQDIANLFMSTMNEFDRREALALRAGLATLHY